MYFRIEVLREKVNIDDGIGYPDWQLTLCLLVSWAVTFFICAKGVQSSGKASYFLAIFPFIILFALLIRSVTLEGAGTGILYFISPDWEKLKSAKVPQKKTVKKRIIKIILIGVVFSSHSMFFLTKYWVRFSHYVRFIQQLQT